MTERNVQGKSMTDVAQALEVVGEVIQFHEGMPPEQRDPRELDILLGAEDALRFVLNKEGSALDGLVAQGSGRYRAYLEGLKKV